MPTEIVYEKSKARKVAGVVLVAVLVLFTILGLNRSVAAQAHKTAALYEASFGIADQLGERLNAARGLASLASENAALSDLYNALRDAYNALYDAQGPHAQYQANMALETAWQALYTALQDTDLSSDTQQQADYYADTLTNAQRCIDTDGYNAAVAQFQTEVMGTPVTRLFRVLIWAELPEAFA